MAAQEDAEETASFAVGDAVVAVGEEGAEEDEGVEGNVAGGEGVDGEAEIAPASDAGEAATARGERGQGSGAVMAAGVAAAQGETAAFFGRWAGFGSIRGACDLREAEFRVWSLEFKSERESSEKRAKSERTASQEPESAGSAGRRKRKSPTGKVRLFSFFTLYIQNTKFRE